MAQTSYVNPRVTGLFEEGRTITAALPGLGKGQRFGDAATKGHTERAVLELLSLPGH